MTPSANGNYMFRVFHADKGAGKNRLPRPRPEAVNGVYIMLVDNRDDAKFQNDETPRDQRFRVPKRIKNAYFR
jgi:hypothetical protein